jgi:arsenate reductase
MAEGLARHLYGDAAQVQSAGSSPTTLNPLAVEALREVGIDISAQRAKSIADVDAKTVNLVVTLCAEEVCPVLPGRVERLHWPLPDPVGVTGSNDARMEKFREVRDGIRERLLKLGGERGLLRR